jgi:hypothetical protein
LSPNTTYFYRVRACNGDGCSEFTAEVSVWTPDVPPEAPSGLSAVVVNAYRVDLAWSDGSSNEAGFEVERRLADQGTWARLDVTAPDATGFSDTAVDANTAYLYRVRACNGAGCSAYTNEAAGTTPEVPPDAPSGLSAAATSATTADLEWDDGSDNETGFELERKSGPGNNWKLAAGLSANAEAFADTGLNPNKSYTYRIRACNSAGCSDYSNEAAVSTPDVPPEAPSGLAAVATGSSTVDITWTDQSDNESGFRLERKNGAGGSWAQIATPEADATSFGDTGLDPATEYLYRIRACNDDGCSALSSEASVTTNDVPPEAPAGLAAAIGAGTAVNLIWTDQSHNEAEFRVERKEGAGGAWGQIAATGADAESYGDTGLPPNTNYFYRVVACNPAGCSAYSNEAEITTPNIPPAGPTDLEASATGPTGIDLAWSDQSDNELEFQLERKPTAGGTWSQIATPEPDVEAYSDTGLDPDTGYLYRIQTCNAAGCSEFSNEAGATTQEVPPQAPTGLSTVVGGATTIDLLWTDESSNETEFRVERKQGVGGSWGQIGDTGPDVATYGDTGLQPGATYFYRVQACNTAGCSGYSNEASGTTDAPSGPNLFISDLYITQATQTLDGAVPLVQGKAGYLRVFALASASNSFQPYVRVRFYSGGSLVHTETINPPGASVPTSVNESSLGYSWNVPVSGSLIQPGLAILADVDPSDLVAESDEADNHFPVDGSPAEMDVRTMPPFHVTFVPVKQSVNGLTGNVNGSNAGSFLDDSFERWPMVQADVDIHAEYVTDAEAVQSDNGNGAWGTILSEVNSLRVAEGTGRYYYGVVKVSYGGGIAGMGYLGWPTAIGWDKLPSGSSIAAHEWGHNFNLHHAPGCGAGNPDPSYPHADGKIGVWGLDVATQTLKAPSTFYDLMSYCGPDWVSDYMYQKTLAFMEAHPSQGVPSAGPEPSLLVWGRMDGGRIVLEPAFEVVTAPVLPAQPGPYTLEALDDGGSRLFSYSFEPLEVPDGQEGEGHFAFAVPLSSYDQGSLSRLRVSGGRRSPASREARGGPQLAPSQEPQVSPLGGDQVELTWDGAAFPMVLIRDPATGDVISFARGGEIRLEVPSNEVELVFSDGVRSTGAMRRRVR